MEQRQREIRSNRAAKLTRRAFVYSLGVGALGLAAACTSASSPAAPTSAPASQAAPTGSAKPATGQAAGSGRVTVALPSDVLTLDPSKDTSPISLNVFKNVFDQLTDIRADGSVGPLLAESWDSADAKAWTFRLRTNATFHNGAKVTADDVLWSYQAIMDDEKSPVRAYMTAIDKMEKVDDRTIRFVTKYPFAPFPRQVSLISIVPREAYQSMGADQFARKPVGSGPYKVVTWNKDDRLELEAFAGYHAGAPSIRTVIFRPVPSESSRVAGLESGDLDIVALLPPPEVPRLKGTSGLRVDLVESNRNLYLGLNVKNPPLNNVKFRQAIDAAINREQITKDLLGGLGKPVGQPVASMVFGYDPNMAPTKYDPARAKELLQEAGLSSGVEVLLQYPSNRYAFGNEVVQAIAGQLGAVGIQTKLEGMEYAAFFPMWTGKKLNAAHLFAFGPSIMDADLPLQSLYDSKGRGYWQSEEVDRLFQKQRGQANDRERQATIHEVWKLSREFVPYVWLYTEIQAYGIRDRVDWKPRADERFNMIDARLKS